MIPQISMPHWHQCVPHHRSRRELTEMSNDCAFQHHNAAAAPLSLEACVGTVERCGGFREVGGERYRDTGPVKPHTHSKLLESSPLVAEKAGLVEVEKTKEVFSS
jgi:hypothetical protein